MGAGEAAESLDEVLRGAPILAFRLDAELRVVAWYDTIAGIMGVPEQAALGRPIADVIPTPDGAEGWRWLVAQPFGTRRVWPTHGPGRENLHIACIVQPLRDERGGPRGAMIWGRDLTAELAAERRREREMQAKQGHIEQQAEAIRVLSAPILEVWDRVIALPIVGDLDAARTADMMERLLLAISRVRARYAILDLTGVDAVEVDTAQHLLGLCRAIRLIGAEGVLTGVQPGIARTFVELGDDLSHLAVEPTMRAGLQRCMAALAKRR